MFFRRRMKDASCRRPKHHHHYRFAARISSGWHALLLLLLLVTVTSGYQYTPPPPPPIDPLSRMRAWHCHGHSQRDLVAQLVQARIVQSPAVQQALEQVDRQYFVVENPHRDAPQAIGHGQTLSAPHMHAHVLEQMLPTLVQRQPQQQQPLKVLDVGCGSGYLTAALGRWFQGAQGQPGILHPRPGRVYGLDIVPELVDLTRTNLQKAGCADLLASGVVSLKVGNGWQGWPDMGPFDAIHVGAAADGWPQALATQLKVGGVLLVPIGPAGGAQILYRIERVQQQASSRQDVFCATDYQMTPLLDVRYVPLVQGQGPPVSAEDL